MKLLILLFVIAISNEEIEIDYYKIANELFISKKSSNLKDNFPFESQLIQCDDDIREKPIESSPSSTPSITSYTPYHSNDPYTQEQYGYGQSAYFFDYIDPVLQEEITEAFTTIFNKAININATDMEPPRVFQDPHEEAIYKHSITKAQLKKLIHNWRWETSKSPSEIIKTYDFNNDGRLNPREFIIAMLNINKDAMLSNNTLCSNCMKRIVKKYLSPLYRQCDPCEKDKITSEDIWNNFKYLNRNCTNYNIYQCSIEDYRTSSVNDFILKSGTKGIMTRKQFIRGILLGYWNRHTDYMKVVTGNRLTGKDKRWTDNGMTDYICKRIEMNQIN